MSLEKLTRELGKAIQQDERYLAMQKAIEANEKDNALNELMSKIQLIQVSAQHEASKAEPDEGKMQAYNEEFQGVYTEIMMNPNMQAYEKARRDIDELMNFLTGILAMCVNGDDPDTCDPKAHQCGGDCSGCHCDCGDEGCNH